jgi:hypothetical protein
MEENEKKKKKKKKKKKSARALVWLVQGVAKQALKLSIMG